MGNTFQSVDVSIGGQGFLGDASHACVVEIVSQTLNLAGGPLKLYT